MAIINKTVGTGGDYATFAALQSALDAAGSITDQYHIAVKAETFTEAATFTDDGWAFGAGGYVWIHPETTYYNPNTGAGAKLSRSQSFGVAADIKKVGNVLIEGIAIENPTTASSGTAARIPTNATIPSNNEIVFYRCYFYSARHRACDLSRDKGFAAFCLGETDATDSNLEAFYHSNFQEGGTINCIGIGGTALAFDSDDGATPFPTAINDIAYTDNAQPWQGNYDGSTNASKVNSGIPGTSPYASAVTIADFTDSANRDFTLAGGSGLNSAAGTDASAYFQSNLYATIHGATIKDFYGNDVSAWRIGLASGGASNSAPTIDINAGFWIYPSKTRVIYSEYLNSSDADADPFNYEVVTIPSGFQWRKSGSPMAAGSTFTQSDIDNNLIDVVDLGTASIGNHNFVFFVTDGTDQTPNTNFVVEKKAKPFEAKTNKTWGVFADTDIQSKMPEAYPNAGGSSTGGHYAWSSWFYNKITENMESWTLGGHGDQSFNGNSQFDTTNYFRRLRGYSAASDVVDASSTVGNGLGTYSDGRIAAFHGYHDSHVIAGGSEGRILNVKMTGVYRQAAGYDKPLRYDIATDTALETPTGSTLSACPSEIFSSGAHGVMDASETLYFWHNNTAGNSLYTYNLSDNTWRSHALDEFSITPNDSASVVYDSDSHRAILVGGGYAASIDLPPNHTDTVVTATYTSIPVSGDTALISENAPALCYAWGKAYFWKGGTTITEMDVDTGVCTNIVVDASNSVTPPSTTAYLYRALQPFSREGKKVLLLDPSVNGEDVHYFILDSDIPEITGNINQDQGGFIQSATGAAGDQPVSGAISQSLQAFAQQSEGEALPPVVSGLIQQSLWGFNQDLVGNTDAPNISGSASQQLGAFSQSLSGLFIVDVQGSAIQQLSAFSQSISGNIANAVSGAIYQEMKGFRSYSLSPNIGGELINSANIEGVIILPTKIGDL